MDTLEHFLQFLVPKMFFQRNNLHNPRGVWRLFYICLFGTGSQMAVQNALELVLIAFPGSRDSGICVAFLRKLR